MPMRAHIYDFPRRYAPKNVLVVWKQVIRARSGALAYELDFL
mgnify:CR=1 FL=1|jgi:hypothetical protein